VGNDPREYRHFNVLKQAIDYDPQGDYIRLWIPELASISATQIHQPWKLSDTERTKSQLKSYLHSPSYAPELVVVKGNK
jgi:deoxyribodipyrimidine photo-lyase